MAECSPARAVTMPNVKWAACSATEFGAVGAYRHLVVLGEHSTACGATATHTDIWRRNSRKPKCPQCRMRAVDPDGRDG